MPRIVLVGAGSVDFTRNLLLPGHPSRTGRRGPGGRREPVAHLPAHLPAARDTRAGDARDLYLRDIRSFTDDRVDQVVPGPHEREATVGLSLFQGQYVGKWPLLMAGALVSVIPMIVLFILAQRHFVRGIAMSGIKG